MYGNSIRALLANPNHNEKKIWVTFPILEEQEQGIIEALTVEAENPLKRFYAVDEELTEAEINALLKEPDIYEIDDVEILDVEADTDFYEIDEAFNEAFEAGLNVSELNELVEEYENWDDTDKALFSAVHYEERIEIDEFWSIKNRYSFYEGRTKQEVAEDWLFDEMYPDFPDELKEYMDFEEWAEDEMQDYTETDWGTYLSY